MQVLIAGAGGALGAAVVDALLKQGATVFGVDRTWQKPHASGLRTISADLTTPEGCALAVSQAEPVDVLVHLVGGFTGGQTIEATGEDVWERMLNLNLRCAVEMFRAVLPGMKARKRGRILAIGAKAGVEAAPHVAAYGASKAALIHLVRSLAAEGKDDGISANTVLPSTIDTAANRAAMPNADYSAWVSPAAIASLLVWLASEEAAAVSGASIPIYAKA